MAVLADDDVVMHGDANGFATSTMVFVIWMSVCDGVGSPDGWLCTRMIAQAERSPSRA